MSGVRRFPRGRGHTMTLVAKGIMAWLAVSFALTLGGIAFVIATTSLAGVAMLVAGALSLVGGPFALVIREGRRDQRARRDALAQLPESRALDRLRGRRIMGGSPELFQEVALREWLEQAGVPGSARIVSARDVSTDASSRPRWTWCSP